jgi:hypothetical protein
MHRGMRHGMGRTVLARFAGYCVNDPSTAFDMLNTSLGSGPVDALVVDRNPSR